MAKISAELEQQLKTNPGQTVNLIVRTHGDATPHLEWLAAAGLQVTQQFKLTPGVAVSGRASSALALPDQEWVKFIELDAPVHTMGNQ